MRVNHDRQTSNKVRPVKEVSEPNKRDDSPDVLHKVALIKNIRVAQRTDFQIRVAHL
jgi:hypothetical protein